MSLSTPALRRTKRSNLAMLRRLWILPVSIVAVAAIAYAVAGVQSSTYSARSTVVVTSVPGPIGSGQSNTSGLASTYSGALPNDPTLLGYVARVAHVNPLGRITAAPPKGSVITLQFFGPTRQSALAGARAIASGLSASNPASSVVTPGTITVVQDPITATPNPAAAVAAATPTATPVPRPPSQADPYVAQVVLLVPQSAAPAEGINPDDANHLAQTYAGIIPVDDGLLSALGKTVNESSSTVGQNLSVVNEQNTSLLQITFKASSPSTATAGARAAAHLLTGQNPAAAGIVPSSLQIVSLPSVGPAAISHTGRTVAIGALLGLILGLILLVAWERSDPHVSDPRSLSTQFGCPATPAERLSPDTAHALIERWASLTDRVPARVAVMPADAATVAQADELVRLLADSGGDVRYVDARSGLLPEPSGNGRAADHRDAVVLVHAGPPGEAGGGEAVALGCDFTVVVIRAGARAAEVRRLAEELANFGIVPAWALLTPRSGHVAAEPIPAAVAV